MVLGGFVGGFGWFWVVLGRFGWFRVLVTTNGMPATGSKELPSTPFLQITSSLHLLGLQDMALSFVQPKNWFTKSDDISQLL